jgi:uncharacterized protein (TIGR02099 family)
MLNRLFSWVGWVLLIVLLLIAIIVALTRQLLPSISEHKTAIEEYISEKAGASISIEAISAHWDGRYPTFHLQNIRTYNDSDAQPEINIDINQVDAEIDLFASVIARFPVFSILHIDKTSVSLYQRDGRWGLEGVSTPSVRSDGFARSVINMLTQQPEVSFSDARLSLHPEQGAVQEISPITFSLNNADDQHYLYGSLTLTLTDSHASNVEFAIETENLPADPLSGDYKLYAKVSNLGQQILNLDLVDLPFDIKDLDMGTELWGRWSNRRAEALQGQLRIKNLSFEQESLENVTNSAVTFSLHPISAEKFKITISDLLVQNSQARIEMPYMSADISLDKGKVLLHEASVKELDIAMWSHWFLGKPYVPESLNDALLKLKPKGYLKNLTVVWADPRNLAMLQGKGDLHDVSVGGYYGAPVLENVTGRITFTEASGSIDLDTESFVMGFPELFSENWKYSEASGRVSWVIEEREGHSRPVVTVNSGLLNLKNASLSAAGRFSMYLPLDDNRQTELTLLIALKNADAKVAPLYIPPEVVGVSLHSWVSAAIQEGMVKDGMLLLRTGTRRLADRALPTVQLYFDVERAMVKFQPDWPVVKHVDMAINVDGESLDIVADNGDFLNSHSSNIEVQLPEKSSRLSVKTSMEGDAKDILTLLKTTPLYELVGNGLDPWSLSGKHKTEVDVIVPLSGKATPVINVSSRLDSGKFQSALQGLEFDSVSGNVAFSTSKGLSSKHLKASFMNAPVTARIVPVKKTQQLPEMTRVYISGKMAVDAVKVQTGLSLLNSAEGSAVLNARLDLCSGVAGCNKLVIDSNLQGVALLAPVPFGKTVDAILPLQVVGQVGGDDPVWRYKLGDQLRGVTKLIEGASRTRISFGGKRPEEPVETGLRVEGSVDQVDLTELKSFMVQNGWWSSESLSAPQDGLKQLALHIKRLSAGDVHVKNVDVVVNAERVGHTAIGFLSSKVAGEIRVPKEGNAPYQINLDYWYVDKSNSSPKDEPLAKGDGGGLDISEWPLVELSIDKMFYDSRPVGQWSMSIEPDSIGQLTVNNILGRIGEFSLTGGAGWRLTDNLPDSYLNLSLEGGDSGSLLKRFGYEGVIESQSTDVTGDVSWSGYPWDFEAKHLNGSFTMLLKQGRIIETGQHSNILRIFGILNLNTVVRRLKLNFTDLVKSGVAFDRVSAHYLLNNGIAYSQKPFALNGPSANVDMQGSINIVDQTLDSEMDVVLPLTSNLPVAAVLLGAPQIAGAVFLLDKLIGDKFEKVSTLKYRLSGSWAEPDIKLVTPQAVQPLNDTLVQ